MTHNPTTPLLVIIEPLTNQVIYDERPKDSSATVVALKLPMKPYVDFYRETIAFLSASVQTAFTNLESSGFSSKTDQKLVVEEIEKLRQPIWVSAVTKTVTHNVNGKPLNVNVKVTLTCRARGHEVTMDCQD